MCIALMGSLVCRGPVLEDKPPSIYLSTYLSTTAAPFALPFIPIDHYSSFSHMGCFLVPFSLNNFNHYPPTVTSHAVRLRFLNGIPLYLGLYLVGGLRRDGGN